MNPSLFFVKPITLPTECTHSNCGSEPARESGLTVDQSLTECTRSNCGSWLASDGGLPADHLPPECTQSNCGSGLARESGLTADQSPTECTRSNGGSWLPARTAYKPTNLPPECTHSNCGSGLARESGLPDDIKTTGAIPVLYTHHKRIAATTFKIHDPLRHNGYNALRRYLHVRQNPPAYTAMGRAISFPCH